MDNELLLASKNDIPFTSAQINIHQPTISEISYIGEETFFSACQLINFGRDRLSTEDKLVLGDKTNFDIFMSIMNEKSTSKHKNNVSMLLALLFPDKQIKITKDEIILISGDKISRINNLNFEEFKDIINSMFGLNTNSGNSDSYNPANSRAKKIAEKLEKRKEKLNRGKASEKVAVFSRYVSILAVGCHKDYNSLMQYTVYQLKDEFLRFQAKTSFDFYLQAKIAGAKDLDEVDNWMNDLYTSSKKL